MNGWKMVSLAAAALVVSGCETLAGPDAFANAEAQRGECKAVVVDSAADVLRLQNQRGVGGTPIDQTEGALNLGRARIDPPRPLRDPAGQENGLTAKLLRDC